MKSLVEFRERLLRWYRSSRRDLPWRTTRDPYRIWLSEIMLQQTRVEAVLPYYNAFLRKYPDAKALASAPENEVLALWSGLGYYSRARNLHRAARSMAEAGAFPTTYAGIRALPGVGDYTAAAIASIAFDLPHAAVDGNVLRVLARVYDDAGDIGSPVIRRRYQVLAQETMGQNNVDARHAGDFNQAMMELGATICLPRAPRCPDCPVRAQCAAHASGRAAELPIKLRRHDPKRAKISVVVAARSNRVLLRQRAQDAARMAGFWELPELAESLKLNDVRPLGSFRHTIVHTTYEVEVFTADLGRAPRGFVWANPADRAIPLTTISRKALTLAGIL